MCRAKSGTPAYMAPESLARSHEHSYQSDYWMIGIIFHELLIGSRPWLRCPEHAIRYVNARKDDARATEELPQSLRFASLVDQDISICSSVSTCALEVLKTLLDVRPSSRLSSSFRELKFFANFDWVALETRNGAQLAPPIVPFPGSKCACIAEKTLDSFGIHPEVRFDGCCIPVILRSVANRCTRKKEILASMSTRHFSALSGINFLDCFLQILRPHSPKVRIVFQHGMIIKAAAWMNRSHQENAEVRV